MSGELIVLLLALILVLLFSATVALALRLPSRARISERLTRAGRQNLIDKLLDAHGELALCAATLRTGCSLALVLVVHRAVANSGLEPVYAQYLTTFAVAMVLVLVFGVAIPAGWAKYAGDSLVARLLPVLLPLRKVLFPLAAGLRLFDALVRRLAGVPAEEANNEAARHEQELLDAVSEGEKLGAFDVEEKEMIESIIDLRDSSVAEIMTPRTEIQAVPKEIGFAEVRALVRDIGHSRIPVYEETIDTVVGVLYAKDLLHIMDAGGFDAAAVMRPATYIPETKNLRDLLHEFQSQKVHMAIVLDEYGGTAGLVTIEDILEELVGEIQDEYDADEPPPMIRIDENTVEVDARVRVEELNEELDIELPEDEDYETIGGFVFSALGRIPTAGEGFNHANVHIQVIEAEARRINRLRVHIDRNSKPPDEAD